MKFSEFLKKVEGSKEFSEFKKKNPEAYLCAGFFVLDFEGGKNMDQIDFYIPKIKKIATFLIDENVKMKLSETLKEKKPLEKLTGKIKIDLESLKGIVEDEMKNRTITAEIKKIIAVIQNVEGKPIWILNCMTSSLGLLKVKVDDSDSSILEFEKLNMMDFIKRVK